MPAAVVLVHGGTLAVEGLKADADAILDAHYPGEVTGAQAIADALWGRFSPAGKLTHSFMPAVYSNLSNFASMSMTDPPGRTYRYYPTSAELTAIVEVRRRPDVHHLALLARGSFGGKLDSPCDKYRKMDSDEVVLDSPCRL